MFIHWGLYAIPARGEWVRSKEEMSLDKYYRYFEEFDPCHYDPKSWAKLAKKSGMKYAILTTKHHDGFCLFDTAYTEYKATNTKAGRDLVKEYVEAFRTEGLKVGFYYSLVDWSHPEYPAAGDRIHPMRNNAEYNSKSHDIKKYIQYYQSQIRELLTNYGKIDVLWFDGSYDDMVGEVWEAEETERMARSLQPDILINDRLCFNFLTEDPEKSSGDYFTPEIVIPSSPVKDMCGNEAAWESCLSLNGLWGYDRSVKKYMTAKDAIHILVECISKGGNLLMNTGPDMYGRIPKICKDIFEEIGEWMTNNKESIYNCGKAEFEKPEWGRLTQNGRLLYAHILDKTTGALVIKNAGNRALKARFLYDGTEINLSEPWNGKYSMGENDLFLNIDAFELPDDKDTVIEIELK